MTNIGNIHILVDNLSVQLCLFFLALSFIISVFMSAKRLLPTHYIRWSAVILLNGIATLAIMGLITQASLRIPQTHQAVLITSGAIQKHKNSSIPTFSFSENQQHDDQRQHDNQLQYKGQLQHIEKLSTPSQLWLRYPQLSELTITGYGLHDVFWKKLPAVNIHFTPPPLSSGITHLSWKRQLTIGNTLKISGRYHYSGANTQHIATAQLLDPSGTTLQEVRLLPNETFSLTTQPKSEGRYLYHLKVNSTDTTTTEPIPVSITHTPPPVMLIMQSSPSFEIKHLKNWAEENQSTLLLKTLISKGKTLTQAINWNLEDELTLTKELLHKIDLFMIDGRALLSLPTQQAQWLLKAVNNGLGVLVFADKDLASRFNNKPPALLRGFQLYSFTNDLSANQSQHKINQLVTPMWTDSNGLLGNQNPLKVSMNNLGLNVTGGWPLTVTPENQLIAAYRNEGHGKIALTIMKESHRWYTSADSNTYSQYWQHLMATLARPRNDIRLIDEPIDTYNGVGYQQIICALSKQDNLTLTISSPASPKINNPNTSSVNLFQGNYLPNQYCAFFWPHTSGWYQFALKDNKEKTVDVSYRYIFDKNDWNSWQQQLKVKATKHQQAQSINISASSTPNRYVLQAIKSTWFWWIFIICCTALWIERKID